MKSYDEIKEILLKEFPKYFELLNIDIHTRIFLFEQPFENRQEILKRNLEHYMECQKKWAYRYAEIHPKDINKDYLIKIYEKELKIYNEIMKNN